MSEPLAYFLTWTCYGTWLHGDARGSVDVDHNTPGTPYLDPHPGRIEIETRRLRRPTVNLTATARGIVDDTIVAHCAHRGWDLLALNVRTNHVHLVLTPHSDVAPERIMSELKGWATRRLREAGCFLRDASIWTEHGSTRYLWKERDVYAAMDYVLERQTRGPP